MQTIATVIAAALLVLMGLPATAQDATPAVLPVTPDPAECTVAPRSLESLSAVLATPMALAGGGAEAGGASASPPPFAVPRGEPADAATAAGVLATGRQLLACFNAGDYLRAFALYTDAAIRQQAGGEPLTDALAAFFAATPVAVSEDARATLLAVGDVRRLADGRVGAFVTQDNPASPPDGPETSYFVLVEQCGRYLVDEIVVGATPPTAGSHLATPAAASEVASPAATPVVSPQAVLAAGVAAGLPGVALAVDRGGETVFSGAAGVASIAQQTPLKATDRFRIYSIAKTFTAVVVLQLVDEDVLTLYDTVATWLDDPVVAKIPNTDRITLRQLLSHTSGVYDFGDESDSQFFADAFLGPTAVWTKVWSPQELLAYADGAKHAPYFEPGAGYHYASTNYILLGLVVEAATGRPFGDEFRSRILEPLALADTSLEMGATLPDDVVDAYQRIEGELVNVSGINLTWDWTAGGMVSTTADLARFARALFGGELLSPASMAEMLTYVSMGRPGLDAGMGVYRAQTPNGELVGMDGGGPSGNAVMMCQAAADVTVVVFGNVAPDEGATDAVRDAAIAWALAN